MINIAGTAVRPSLSASEPFQAVLITAQTGSNCEWVAYTVLTILTMPHNYATDITFYLQWEGCDLNGSGTCQDLFSFSHDSSWT